MVFIRLSKFLIPISLMLAGSFPIQPSFAIDGEKENTNIVTRGIISLSNLMTAAADCMDHLHGIDLYTAQSDPSFFPALPADEITLNIFLYLYEDKTDIDNLCSVALTCKHGYRLMQDSKFGDLLKGAYFGHLP